MAPQRRRSAIIALLTLCAPLVQREAPRANASPPRYPVGTAKQRGRWTGKKVLQGLRSDRGSLSEYQVLQLQKWRALLDDPSVWNDHRSAKASGQINPRYPDFTHSPSQDGLWMPGPRQSWSEGVLQELERLPPTVFRSSALWADYFRNPEEWVDYRRQKLNGEWHPQYPDFRRGQDVLWLCECPSPEKLPKTPRKLQANTDDSLLELQADNDDSLLEQLPQTPPKQVAKQQPAMNEARLALWKSVIEEPDNWVDRRGIKEVHCEPDFLHKTTRAALWLTETGIPDHIRELVEERDGQLQEEVATPADFLESLDRQWSVLVDEVRE